MDNILNISSYRFVALPDAADLRLPLLEAAQARGLRGTILLATEGINLFLAGAAEDVRGFLDQLRQDPRLADLEAKESWSDAQPFKKMLVKVKPEIIRMDHPAIQPQSGRAPAVDAKTLQRWLEAGHDDNGRPVVTLDTRNAFEVDHGTFQNAIDWRIERFTQFPDALRKNREALEGKTVVSFCTGGIRCEKAAILMAEEGVENVYQLEGGILKYFEETGGAFYDGRCFVFDDRVALDAGLAPLADSADHRGFIEPGERRKRE